MTHRPLIGINMDFRASVKSRVLHSLMPTGYYDCLLNAKALPIMIPPVTREADLLPILEKLDGVVLTGGDDLEPRRMGLPFHPSVTPIPERREMADRLLCKLAQQQKIPTLGIGLGAQEMNVVAGGALYIHLPEDMPKGIRHYDPHGGAHRHTVTMRPKTLLASIYGPGEILVNSYHHMGIRKLAPNFRASALAPDGLIEAFESKDPTWWAVGVQWHPENEGHMSLDMQLVEAFVETAGAARNAPALAKVG